MRLIHYSRSPLSRVRVVRQSDRSYRIDKPCGFWVSVGTGDDSWFEWCQSEGFCLERLRCATEVALKKEAKILYIKNARQLDRFTDRFGIDYPKLPVRFRDLQRKHGIDWKRVAQRYDGIVIAPYIWSRRLMGNSQWYYSWDCASGCIWNAKAIVRLKPIFHARPRERRYDDDTISAAA